MQRTCGHSAKRRLQRQTYRYVADGRRKCIPQVLERYVHPDDPYCMADVHAYAPWWFCLVGGWEIKPEHRLFNTDGEKEITTVFNVLNEMLVSKNIPFLMGETGATRNVGSTEERIKWANVYFTEARKIGMPTAVHSDVGPFRQMDYKTATWTDTDYLNAIFKAYFSD